MKPALRSLWQEVSFWFSKQLGDRGERTAARFLKKLGYRIVARQFRNQIGELDLIAIDGETVVFVEVKTRTSRRAGAPSDAVDSEKQQQIIRTALAFLSDEQLLDGPARFDIVAIDWPEDSESERSMPAIEHFIDAFTSREFGQFHG